MIRPHGTPPRTVPPRPRRLAPAALVAIAPRHARPPDLPLRRRRGRVPPAALLAGRHGPRPRGAHRLIRAGGPAARGRPRRLLRTRSGQLPPAAAQPRSLRRARPPAPVRRLAGGRD